MYSGALPPASNRGAYSQQFQLFDDETDDGIDLSGARVVLEIRKAGRASVALSATMGNGRIALSGETGVFELQIAAEDMRALEPFTYEVGMTITQDGETTQHFIGTLPVLDGIVS